MRLVLPVALLLVALVPPASAQTEMVLPVLEFGAVAAGLVPIDGTADLVVDWTYTFAPAAASPGGTTINWALDRCGELMHFPAAVATPVTYEVGQTSVSGTALLPIQAGPEAPGLTPLGCVLLGTAVASPTTLSANGSATVDLRAAYVPALAVTFNVASKQAGPQKVIPYEIEIENRGNARTAIRFEVLEGPKGKRWDILLPDALILDSPVGGGEGKTKETVLVSVATPFENGYVKESGDYRIVLRVAAADDAAQKGSDVELDLNARAQGWYVPGASPVILAAALVALAALLRRR